MRGSARAPRASISRTATASRSRGSTLARASFNGKYLVVKIDGELTVGNGQAQFQGEDPGFLWRNRAKDYIQGKLAKYLDPKVTSADLPTG